MEVEGGGGGNGLYVEERSAASDAIVAKAQRFESLMHQVIDSIATDRSSPLRLREAVTELAELGRQLRVEFEKVYQEEESTMAAGGDRQAALAKEIAELEAAVRAKDALLERYARKVAEWQRTFDVHSRLSDDDHHPPPPHHHVDRMEEQST